MSTATDAVIHISKIEDVLISQYKNNYPQTKKIFNKDNNAEIYCKYHKNYFHSTENCRALKYKNRLKNTQNKTENRNRHNFIYEPKSESYLIVLSAKINEIRIQVLTDSVQKII